MASGASEGLGGESRGGALERVSIVVDVGSESDLTETRGGGHAAAGAVSSDDDDDDSVGSLRSSGDYSRLTSRSSESVLESGRAQRAKSGLGARRGRKSKGSSSGGGSSSERAARLATHLTPQDIERVHAAFVAAAATSPTGTIDVWQFQDLVETMPWDISHAETFDLMACVKHDGKGAIDFPAVLAAVDEHVRARFSEPGDFTAAWIAMGGSPSDPESTVSVDVLLRATKRFDLALNVSDLVQFSTTPSVTFDEFRSFVLTGSTTGSSGAGAR